MIRSYQDLEVWKKAIKLVKIAYDLASAFPKTEQFGLISQIQRSATSIPANIAEGRCRSSRKEFSFFLRIAAGSLAELETHFFVAMELEYLNATTAQEFFDHASEVGRMLNGLLKSLQQTPLKPETQNLEAVS